jgi:hypothetical protein
MASEKEAREVKRRHPELLETEGVSGVGVERNAAGNYFLAAYVDSGDPESGAGLPKEVEGVEVRLVRGGPFRKL